MIVRAARARGGLDLPVWVAFGILLVLGWLVLRSVEARTAAFADPQGSLQLSYPATWFPVPGSTNLLEIQDPLSGGPVPLRLIVTREAVAPGRALGLVVGETILARAQQRPLYRVLHQEPVQAGGREGAAVEYAFVTDPHQTVLAAERVPVVLRGIEVIVPSGSVIYHIDLQGPAERFGRSRAVLDRLLRGLRV